MQEDWLEEYQLVYGKTDLRKWKEIDIFGKYIED